MRDSFAANTMLDEPFTVLFGGSFRKDDPGGYLLFSDPVDTIALTSPDDLRSFFGKLEAFLAEGFSLAGYVGYEAGYGFEPESFSSESAAKAVVPLAWFGAYRSAERLSGNGAEGLFAGQCRPGALQFDLTQGEYAEKIDEIKKHIAAGDVYQVNFTGRYRFDYGGSASSLFRYLSSRQPGAYSAWMNLGEHQLVSFSPELFFRMEGNGIETRPMKGTAPRGSSEYEDRLFREWLGSNEKNRAENLMIVDLLRNDLGRICKQGSVDVPELFSVETYPTLHQMVSSVRGEVQDDISLYELFRALFPCGSVTGAPKIRAMQLIQELERSPRGVYTGATGYMLPDRSMCFNVAIRTAMLCGHTGEYGAGGGIVWDSNTGEEYNECRLKAKILEPVTAENFGIFETILYNGSLVWLDEHLFRLSESARCLGFSCNLERIRRELERLTDEELRGRGRCKVRLELHPEGTFQITVDDLSERSSSDPVPVCRAGVSLPSEGHLRMHKTTRRKLYDELLRKAKKRGYDELVFCNDRGEVAEGAISNIIIFSDGQYVTPSLSSGLLNGIYRQYFLSTRMNVQEAILTMHDIEQADLLFVCNSLRGLRRAVLFDEVVHES
ncbi:MAG: aminodeoxychorismate synthase component I [Ignavibacteriaceae bacterium]|nr:aminodeoxychorismate synthase component I [Ignavibacteriaceae bacterium]